MLSNPRPIVCHEARRNTALQPRRKRQAVQSRPQGRGIEAGSSRNARAATVFDAAKTCDVAYTEGLGGGALRCDGRRAVRAEISALHLQHHDSLPGDRRRRQLKLGPTPLTISGDVPLIAGRNRIYGRLRAGGFRALRGSCQPCRVRDGTMAIAHRMRAGSRTGVDPLVGAEAGTASLQTQQSEQVASAVDHRQSTTPRATQHPNDVVYREVGRHRATLQPPDRVKGRRARRGACEIGSLDGGDQAAIVSNDERHVRVIVREEGRRVGQRRPSVEDLRTKDHVVGSNTWSGAEQTIAS